VAHTAHGTGGIRHAALVPGLQSEGPAASITRHIALHAHRCDRSWPVGIDGVLPVRRCRIHSLDRLAARHGLTRVVDLTVAVLIDAVAGLGGAGVDGGLGVVAVGGVGDVAGGRGAGLGGDDHAAKAVAVGVVIIGGLYSFVDGAVTVLVG